MEEMLVFEWFHCLVFNHIDNECTSQHNRASKCHSFSVCLLSHWTQNGNLVKWCIHPIWGHIERVTKCTNSQRGYIAIWNKAPKQHNTSITWKNMRIREKQEVPSNSPDRFILYVLNSILFAVIRSWISKNVSKWYA